MKLLTMCCLAAAFAFAACKESTSPDNNTPTDTKPKTGSSYTYTQTDTTTTGTETTTTKDTMVASGLTIDGKSNVLKVFTLDASGAVTDSAYVAYESNGDVSRRPVNPADMPLDGLNLWFTLPFSSQGTIALGSYDTTMDIQGVPATLHFAFSASGAGSGTQVVKGTSYSTKKAKLLGTLSISVMGQVISTDTLADQTMSYSPQLGWVTSIQSATTTDPSGARTDGSFQVLTEFTKK